jgi:hypothetical protein
MLRGRRRAAPVALGLAALAVAGVAAATQLDRGDDVGARKRSTTGASATVTRRTLVERETVDGTLGYAGHRTVINRLAASSAEGGDSPSGNSPAADKPAASDSGAAATPAALFTPDPPPDGSQDPEDDSSQDPKDDESGDDAPTDGNDDDSDRNDSDNKGNDDANGSQPDGSQGDDRAPSGSDDDSSDDGSSPSASGDSDSSGDDSYQGSGTLTAMARSGSVIRRGGALYRLDGDPVVLMYGSAPAYRALGAGVSDGPDVRELERNLAALGFDPGGVDDSFTSATATAVGDWQESVGLTRTGAVELGRIVFMPGARRVGGQTASLGSVLGAGAEVLDTSATKRVVSIPLDATKQSLAREGAAVTVTLPDGRLVRGRISHVGRVAREEAGSGDDPNAQQQLVIDVTVELRSKRGIGRLDEAPVSVGLASQTRKHVLAVPVNALVARRGGGYGVELSGSQRIVPVEAGLFADGYVEVSGRGIAERARVVVPRD